MTDTNVAEVLNGPAQERLRGIIEQIESSNARKAEEAEHCKDIYAAAKNEGYDVKALRKTVKLLKIERAKREQDDAMTQLYLGTVEG